MKMLGEKYGFRLRATRPMPFDDFYVSIMSEQYKKTKFARRQTTGFILLAIGSLVGFIGFILTILNPFPNLYNFCLIGLTSIAATIICLGLYYLLE
jgi:cell division protein FtsW (lipid II flippase)